MLSDTKTGGVLERGWAHPAGSDGSRCCRAAVMGHAAARYSRMNCITRLAVRSVSDLPARRFPIRLASPIASLPKVVSLTSCWAQNAAISRNTSVSVIICSAMRIL